MIKEIMRFYGTSAAEAIPSPFCKCPVCENARQKRGRELRRRSMFRVSEDICFDLGPDAVAQAMDFESLVGLRHVLVTHTHEDHFYTGMPNVRAMAYDREPEPLTYYLCGKAYDIVDHMLRDKALIKGALGGLVRDGVVAFQALEYGVPAQIGDITATPLRGNHKGNMGEDSANYLVSLPDGRKLFYGLDTGWYYGETFEALREQSLDILISECTWGDADRGEKPDNHLDFQNALKLFRLLLENGALTAQSSIYLTHINHKHTATHERMEELAEKAGLPCSLTVAYDGMRV